MNVNDARNRIECERCLEWIENALDDHLDPSRKSTFDEHIAGCESCAVAYEDARIVHDLFQRAGRPVCPDHVVDSILAQVDAHIEMDSPAEMGTDVEASFDAGTSSNGGPDTPADDRTVRRAGSSAPVGRWLDRRWLARPAWIGAAAVVVLFFTLWLPGRIEETEVEDTGTRIAMSDEPETLPGTGEPTEAEIEAAADEMKMALALVSRTMVRTTHILGSEVSGHLSRPLRSNFEPFLKETPEAGSGVLHPLEDGQSSLSIPLQGEC